MKTLIYGEKIAHMFFGDLLERFGEEGVEYTLIEPVADPAALTEASGGHQAVITFFPFSADMIRALAPSVCGLVVTSIGYDNIDVAAANEKGIMVCNIPDYSTEEVALHSVTLLLAALRNLCLYDKTVREGGWTTRGSIVCGRPRHRLSTMTMGFLGFGRIGQRVAKMMSGFDVRFVAYDPYLPAEVFEQYNARRAATPEELYAASDILSLHMLLNDETYHMVSKDKIELMKDGVIIVNTARGALLDLDAVTEALKSGKIGAAGIDVWEHEPPASDEPILQDYNAVVTPHCAFFSIEANLDLRVKSVLTGVALCKGEVPYNCVNKKALGLA